MLPKRRKPEKLGVRQEPQIRSQAHLKWIRGHECSVAGRGSFCDFGIEAAHVRTGTDGGTSVKPSDCWALPLCCAHHAEQHRAGEASFQAKYKIDMKAIAKALWDKSPHRHKSQPTTDRRNVRG